MQYPSESGKTLSAFSVLAVTVRDAAQSLLNIGHVELCSLVEALKARDWLIFRRLALYFLASATSAPRESAGRRPSIEQIERHRRC
jgi:hypothetical protein